MKDRSRRIFLSPPVLTGKEEKYIRTALASRYLAPLGPEVVKFEREVGEIIGGKICVALSTGTAAIHLALLLAGVGVGDRVLVSDLTFISSAAPILYVGARPVFIDSAPKSWNMDIGLVEKYLERCGKPRPKALILVHLFGQPADINRAQAVCEYYRMELIEDAAGALGATYGNQPVGGIGRLGVLSFNGNKIVTTSSGGMLVCQDATDAARARFLAGMAKEPGPGYVHLELGYSYGLSNICAAIGRAQLKALPERLRQKRALAVRYRELLTDVNWLEFLPEPTWGKGNEWLTCVLFGPDIIKGAQRQKRVHEALVAENIEAPPIWRPMHAQPLFADYEYVCGETGSISEELWRQGLCLPSGAGLNNADLERVCRIIQRSM
ncbi:putative pyridoxal phosphate-dependent aminotransferase EpsN [Desulfovibrionales bacterium]